MSGGNVVAKAWVEIIPEMSGIREEISKELGAPLEREAKKAGKSAAEIEAAAKEASDMAMAGVKPADDSEAADQVAAKDEEPKKKAKEPAAPLTPEEERLAAAAQVAREFANSKR